MCARSSHSWTVCHETEESITPFSQVEFWEAPPLYHCDYKTTERKQPRYVIKSLFQRNKSGKGSPLFLDCQWISACLHSRITWEAFKNERYRYLIFRNSNLIHFSYCVGIRISRRTQADFHVQSGRRILPSMVKEVTPKGALNSREITNEETRIPGAPR